MLGLTWQVVNILFLPISLISLTVTSLDLNLSRNYLISWHLNVSEGQQTRVVHFRCWSVWCFFCTKSATFGKPTTRWPKCVQVNMYNLQPIQIVACFCPNCISCWTDFAEFLSVKIWIHHWLALYYIIVLMTSFTVFSVSHVTMMWMWSLIYGQKFLILYKLLTHVIFHSIKLNWPCFM